MADADFSSRLPAALLRYFADSEVFIEQWDENSLVLRVMKEVECEVGRITFRDVSHVSLPPRFGVAGIKLLDSKEIPRQFFELHCADGRTLDADQRFFLFSGSWGEIHFVIAGNLEYVKVG